MYNTKQKRIISVLLIPSTNPDTKLETCPKPLKKRKMTNTVQEGENISIIVKMT